MDWILFLINNQSEILIYIFAIIGLFLLSLSLLSRNNKEMLKIGGLFLIIFVLLRANNFWIYLVSIFIIGTIITGKSYLLSLITEWRTKTEKNIIHGTSISQKSIPPINTKVEENKKV